MARPGLVAVLAWSCVIAGCTESTRPSASTARRDETVDAGAPVIAQTAAPWDGGLPPFAAWTDPAAIDALLRGADLPSGETDPRSCNFEVPNQSCVPGAGAVDWGCRSDCATACGGCASACRGKIAGCRSACAGRDAACERACGAEAGKCVEGCLRGRDGCTAECVKRVAEYNQEVRANYGCTDKRPALEICKRAVACVTACDEARTPEPKREACRASCKKSRAAGCHDAFLQNVDIGNCFTYESPI